jgi:hypothetical protein
MQPIQFALTLSGTAVEVDRGQLWAETAADDGAAVCRRRIEVWDDGTVAGAGELSFGEHDTLSFRARGSLGSSPDPHRRHGTAVLEVTGGRGRLAGARGYVTSNFLLSDTGALADHHLGLVFAPEWQSEKGA